MRIVGIETFGNEHVALVHVRTDEGADGWGQIAPYHARTTIEVLHRQVAPHALGRDPLEIDAFVDEVPELEYKFRGSHLFRALGGVETALWDLRGKLEGKGVCELLGGVPTSVAAYGSSMRRDISAEDEAGRLARLRDRLGFGAFKVRIGRECGRDEDQWPGRTEEVVSTVRAQLGEDVDLLVDANGGFSPARAIQVGRMLEEHDVCHFEEPCPYWRPDWTRRVTEALDVDVAGGEQDWDEVVWEDMIQARVVDVVQPDVCYAGGFTRALRFAQLAADLGIPCTPHAANHSLVVVFTLHFLACADHPGPYLEFSIEPDEDYAWQMDMYEPRPRVVGGRVDVPDGPGWGVEISPTWLERAERRVTQDAS